MEIQQLMDEFGGLGCKKARKPRTQIPVIHSWLMILGRADTEYVAIIGFQDQRSMLGATFLYFLQLHAMLPRPFNEQRVIATEAQREAYGIVI